MSFPPGTEMFQFPGFASSTYEFSAGSPIREGFPHSDIRGSTIARISPRLFAACHVLHRLLAPRHPPNALHSLLSPPPARRTNTQGFRPPHQAGMSNRTADTETLSTRPAEPARHHNRLAAAPGAGSPSGHSTHQTIFICQRTQVSAHSPSPACTVGFLKTSHQAGTASAARPPSVSLTHPRRLVETVGIEPTTPCLQSRRSPTELRPLKPSSPVNGYPCDPTPAPQSSGGPGRT